MKPFMRNNTSEFCSACHKVHLDVPVNSYRWFRGFNDYDNWQASGFGEGARSFYYPPQGATCGGCHMPKIAQTIADINVRSHTFAFITPEMTDRYKIPNACTGCHTDKTTTWATDALKTWSEVSPWRVQ